MRLGSKGIAVDVPQGWDGEIYERPSAFRPLAASTEKSSPVVHLANFPLGPGRGDFGSGAVEVMSSDNILVVLFEYGADSVGTALFASAGIPVVADSDFSPHTMQRPLPGQSGAQYFFTQSGRPFCLYVVLGSHARRKQLVPEVNDLLGTMTIAP